MANTINLAAKYLAVIDEIYKTGSRTAMLDATEGMYRQGDDAATVYLAYTELQGLANYNKSTGFTDGTVNLSWKPYTLEYDRGRRFSVDRIDNMESMNLAFAPLVGQFLREEVIPELDAVRFMKYYKGAYADNKVELTTGFKYAAAIRDAELTMDDDEVPDDGRILFMTPDAHRALSDEINAGAIKNSTKAYDTALTSYDGMQIVRVPQNRFYTDLTLSTTANGGYEKGTTAKNLKFMIVHPSAVMQVVKHALPRIFTADQNINLDANQFDYRIRHDALIKENKTTGIYAGYVS